MPNLTAPQLAQLATRLQQPDTLGKPDWEAANILNTPSSANGSKSITVTTEAFRRALVLTDNGWTRMKNALTGTPTQAVALAVNDLINIGEKLDSVQVQPDGQIILAHLNTLVAAGTITANTRSAVIALAPRDQTWAESVGFAVDSRNVGLARGGI